MDSPLDNPLSSEKQSGNVIHLAMDDRECRGPMPAALAANGTFAVEVRRLPVGDYCLDDALLFERKTLPDLVASIKDGRLFDQALRLAHADLRGALILEGVSRDMGTCGMRMECIRGALINVSLFIGLPVLRTRDPLDTVRTLAYATQQRRALVAGGLPRHGRRPKGKAALQSYVLQGLPGIGPRRAARLIQRFGSIEAAVAADANALAAVGGIGALTARKLRWCVEEPHEPYSFETGPTRRTMPTSRACHMPLPDVERYTECTIHGCHKGDDDGTEAGGSGATVSGAWR